MNIRNTIEKDLIRQVKSELDEIDIEGMVRRLVQKKEVQDAVMRLVQDKIAQLIQDRAYLKIKNTIPIIDATINEKVQEFLYSLGVKG